MKTMLDSILAAPPSSMPEVQTSSDEFKKLIKSSVRAGSCASNPEGSCASYAGASCVSNPEGHCASGGGSCGSLCGGGCSVGPGGSL